MGAALLGSLLVFMRGGKTLAYCMQVVAFEVVVVGVVTIVKYDDSLLLLLLLQLHKSGKKVDE